MNLTIEIPKVRKVEQEAVFTFGCRERAVTRVYFKDGMALTFSGRLVRKEAVFNAYYQKAMDLGMSGEEASIFAGQELVVPLRGNK